MNNSFTESLNSAKSVLVLLPANPRFDEVASGLALFLAVKQTKDAVVSSPAPMVVEFNRLVGVNKISSELGNRDLMIKFVNYPVDSIERVNYEIENNEFHLKLATKPGRVPPQKDETEFVYSGISADLIVLVGGADINQFPALDSKDLEGAKIVHVGIKALNGAQGKNILSFAKPSSSVSELTATFIKEAGLQIDGDIATNLLMGIEDGSQAFAGANVSAETFALMAELMKAGGRRLARDGQADRKNFPPGAIPGEEPQETPAPKSWFENPKVYKGTSVS